MVKPPLPLSVPFTNPPSVSTPENKSPSVQIDDDLIVPIINLNG